MIKKALILAAGKGTRMGHLTAKIPKPMLPVAGRPLLDHVLTRLKDAGIREALIVVGVFAEQIEEHASKFPIPVSFATQQIVNGTARAALLGRAFAGGDPFILTFGDILCPVDDYRGLADRLTPGTSAVLGVKWAEDPWRGAAVYEAGGVVSRVVEKPPKGTSSTNWNSAGVYAFAPQVFAELERVPVSSRGEYELTSAVAQLIESGRTVRMYAIQGDWIDVGTPEDLQRAEDLLD